MRATSNGVDLTDDGAENDRVAFSRLAFQTIALLMISVVGPGKPYSEHIAEISLVQNSRHSSLWYVKAGVTPSRTPDPSTDDKRGPWTSL